MIQLYATKAHGISLMGIRSTVGYLAVCCTAAGALAALVPPRAAAQAQQPPAGQPAAEVTTNTVGLTFKSTVNFVSVPVVVRDSKGRAVGNLEREDFRLSDNGKPQTVSKFSVEKFGESAPAEPSRPAPAAKPVAMPQRYVALFFDDMRELEEKLAYCIAHRDVAAAIARAGHEHFLRYHTGSARAKQALAWMRQCGAFGPAQGFRAGDVT